MFDLPARIQSPPVSDVHCAQVGNHLRVFDDEAQMKSFWLRLRVALCK